MEHLLEKYSKKWSNFDEMAPKSGAPIWKRGFRGLCTLNGCTKGLVGTKCVSGAKDGKRREEQLRNESRSRWNFVLQEKEINSGNS